MQRRRLGVRALLVLATCATLAGSAACPATAEAPAVISPAGALNASTAPNPSPYLPDITTRLLAHLHATPQETPSSGTGGDSDDIPVIPVPYYSQRDPRWACDRLGTCVCDKPACPNASYTTIADAGCYPTCQAMVFAYYAGDSWLTPGQYNQCLILHDGYRTFDATCPAGLCAARDDPPLPCRPEGVSYLGASLDRAVLDHDLRRGYPSIAVINVDREGVSPHAVVVIGKQGGRYIVNDPYYGVAPDHHTLVSTEAIYGLHRWLGPIPSTDGIPH